jgi:hypothetical protein
MAIAMKVLGFYESIMGIELALSLLIPQKPDLDSITIVGEIVHGTKYSARIH